MSLQEQRDARVISLDDEEEVMSLSNTSAHSLWIPLDFRLSRAMEIGDEFLGELATESGTGQRTDGQIWALP